MIARVRVFMIAHMKNNHDTPTTKDTNPMYYTFLSLFVSQSSSHYEY